jgi:uncharacterized protein (TIGR02246 family)
MFIAGGFRTVKTCLVLPENSGGRRGRLGNDEGEHQMASRLIKLSCAVSVGFAAFSAPGLATECANKDEIVGLFTKWDAALQTGDPETVADLYAKDGVLLPTVSNKVRTDHAAIVDYFHHFLELKPKGTLNEIHVTCLGDDTAINQGIYTFDVVKGGQPSKVQARYSYVYHKEDGEWKIVSHHSSAMPEPVAAK